MSVILSFPSLTFSTFYCCCTGLAHSWSGRRDVECRCKPVVWEVSVHWLGHRVPFSCRTSSPAAQTHESVRCGIDVRGASDGKLEEIHWTLAMFELTSCLWIWWRWSIRKSITLEVQIDLSMLLVSIASYRAFFNVSWTRKTICRRFLPEKREACHAFTVGWWAIQSPVSAPSVLDS